MGARLPSVGALLAPLACLLVVGGGPRCCIASAGTHGLLAGWAQTWPQLKDGYRWSCYQYIHAALNSPMSADLSPAEYGYRICKAVESSKKCSQQLQPAAIDEAVSVLLRHLEHAADTFCDPDCPFIQAQLCYWPAAYERGACRNSAALFRCMENQLSGLKCKSKSKARQFWSVLKATSHLIPCASEARCQASLSNCHGAILDRALPLQLKQGYCQHQKAYEDCLKNSMSQACARDQLIATAILDEAKVLYNSTCMG